MAKGFLKCKKFAKEFHYEEAECPRPEEYCDNREKCAVWFLTKERRHERKARKEVMEDALV